MKTLANNFGITGYSTPDESFFEDLEKPVNWKRVRAAKKYFKNANKVKVEIIEPKI